MPRGIAEQRLVHLTVGGIGWEYIGGTVAREVSHAMTSHPGLQFLVPDPAGQADDPFLKRSQAEYLVVDDAVYYAAPSEEPRDLAETWRRASFAAGQMAILTAQPVPQVGASACHLKDAADAAVLVVYEAYDGEGAIFFERQRDQLPDVPKESWEDWYLRSGEGQLRMLARVVWDPIGIGDKTPTHELDEVKRDRGKGAAYGISWHVRHGTAFQHSVSTLLRGVAFNGARHQPELLL